MPDDNDKNPVIALREIADGTVAVEHLHENLVRSHQRHAEVDEPEEDDMAQMLTQQFAAESERAGAASEEFDDSEEDDEAEEADVDAGPDAEIDGQDK